MKRTLSCRAGLGVAAAGIALLLAGCNAPTSTDAGDDEPADIAEIEQRARDEGELTLYTGSAAETMEKVAVAFEAAYPEIDVTVLRLSSNALAARFVGEAESDVFVADVYDAGSPVIYADYSEYFTPVDSLDLPSLEGLDDEAINEYYVTYGVANAVLAYNTEAIDAADAPREWEEVLDPRYRGRIAMNDPRSAEPWMSWANLMYETFGQEFLEGIAAQEPVMFDSGVPAVQQTVAGSFDIAFPVVESQTRPLILDGAPLGVIGIEDGELEPAQGHPRIVSIPANAPHPNAARLFFNWWMSPEAATIICDVVYTSAVEGAENCASLPNGHAPANYEIPQARRDLLLELLGLSE